MKVTFVVPHGDQTKRGEEVEALGVDYESRLTFIKDKRNILIIHQAGGTHWESILEPRVPHPAKFLVFQVIEREDSDRRPGHVLLHCDELIDFEVRKR